MKRTAGGNLRELEKKWFRQPMFSNPPRIRLKWWKTSSSRKRR